MEALNEGDDSVELEAKRKEDSSWHPCRVSLSSSGDSLIVNFGSQELEDILLKKEEVLTHLRFRSVPLQVDDCSNMEEGERVLVNHKLESKNLFHDAELEKADRIRHSKRGCRCTFMIKWLDNDLEGQTVTVPSSSIMKLATKSISAHPIVHVLLKPEKDTDLSYSSPLLTILEGTDAEMELNMLLQKQIEQISKLANVSEKDFPEDILWRNNVHSKGQRQTPHNPTAESSVCIPAVPDHHNHLRRTTRSKTKLQVDIEAKDQAGTATSKQEEFIQNRSRLSPLASRAALASSLLTARKCLDMDFSSCMTANMFVKDKCSSEILAISVPLVSEASHAMSPLISTQGDASWKPSSCVTTNVWGNENKTSEKMNANGEDRTSAAAKVTTENFTSKVANSSGETMIADKKPSVLTHFNASSTAPMRVTRSAMQKGAVIPNGCIQVKICTDNKKRRISGKKNKLRHSEVCQENENLANEEDNNSTHVIDSDSFERNIAIPESDVSTTKTATSKKTKDAFTPCKDAASGRSDQGKKRKAVYPNKQERRFSPRNFLPRTRSQHKSLPGK